MYLVKPLFRDKCKGQIHNVSAPFRTKESVGRKGQIHCVSALFPCPEVGALPDTWAIPKHTSG